jgi:hypothetical protein
MRPLSLMPNPRAALDAAAAVCLRAERHRRGPSERERYAARRVCPICH